MDSIFIAIDYRDPLWIAIAFAFGLFFKQMKLPPMVGFLVAGFVLNFLGAESDKFLVEIADLGITLLLFTIGLKLRLGTLIRPEIWATTTIHMTASIILATALLLGVGAANILMFGALDLTGALIVAFALSFSSTVFAVKTLEDRGALASRYGQVAIGVLVMQDIAAVIFLAVSAGKIPSMWSIGLLLLIPGRHLLGFILTNTGHKELLSVFGFVMALGGAAVFELVGMKGDLGALIFGVLLAQHPRASELSKNLMGFKDVFLVCFFLTIGLTGLPSWEASLTALVLLILIPFKTVLFLLLLTKFRLRAWGATLGAAILGNYSEFGLIVAAIAISTGWVQGEWLTVIALAVSASFLLSSPLNSFADAIYGKFSSALLRLENDKRLKGDEDIPIQGSQVLIFGMGRVGRAAYDEMLTRVGDEILGIDLDEKQVEKNIAGGRRVVLGDATHPEFWSRVGKWREEINLILLAMPNHTANINATKRLRERGYTGPIVATALYPDQEEHLKANGVDDVYNIYAEAGAGAALHLWRAMEEYQSNTAKKS
ncbi:MAG: cation:proton antiporter [Alphaproteobacteria bacterium]|nr:cation:proton antiporter [Rhodospirillales bacterium]MCW9045893.1 cation:proton antiporter [Alphaproteobacteria bacterium]